MRRHFNFFAILIFALALVLSSCQKDQSFDQPITTDGQINDIVDRSWERMASEDLFPENPSLGIDMLNEGIAADFLLDETHIDDAPPANMSNPSIWYSIRDHSLIQCLRGLELSNEQVEAIRLDLRLYEQCKSEAVQRARAIYRELRIEYHQKFQRLVDAFRNGTITEREFKARVAELRTEFRLELRRLHLQERIDQAFKRCLRQFMGELHGVLTDLQWSSFIECYRGL